MNPANVALKPSPYQQLLALPKNLVGEVINGRLYTQPRPTGPHAVAESGLALEFRRTFRQGQRRTRRLVDSD